MVQNMTISQAIELAKFIQLWHLPDTETKRRIILIADRITENKGMHHLSDGYFKIEHIKSLVNYANGMAGLRPITDEMLMNFIDGLSKFGLYFKYKRKQDKEEIDRLVNPAFNIQREYFSQEQWIDFLLDSEVAGDEILEINNMKIPFSHEAIKIFLRKKGIKSLLPSHFPKVKADFRKFNIELYGDETPNPAKNHIIRDDTQMNSVYTICKEKDKEAFNCDYELFRVAIETANFNKLDIKRLNITQDLTYRLSGIMGKKWYTEVCKTMGWKKPTCSGQGKKVEDDILIRKLNKILPRPLKE